MLKLLRKRPLLLVLLLFGLVYLAYGYYLGHIVKSVTVSAFESYKAVENNPYLDIISDENYNHLVKRQYHDFTLPNTYDKYFISPALVIHWFDGAIAYIRYNYEYFQNDEINSGSMGVVVKFTLKLQDGQWKIVDIYEGP